MYKMKCDTIFHGWKVVFILETCLEVWTYKWVKTQPDTPLSTGFAAVLAVLKLERLKADRARMYEEASKIEWCPSEIILDDLLALDSIVRFDLSDRRLEQTDTFSISTDSDNETTGNRHPEDFSLSTLCTELEIPSLHPSDAWQTLIIRADPVEPLSVLDQ
uniref:Uncharacterized protein n=1 Tax=Tanacetum cinerariifolium TaxID=118510 RepID=A0A6L2NB86_TANCI|nr:hypothetical protein [Tanacetum cinerariifolium]